MTERSQNFSHRDYTVGWICALSKTELVAAKAMLDEQHPLLPAADPQHDSNAYDFGRIGDHNVVISCLPAGMTGKVSAATVAKDMIRSFPNVRFGLMVGIGGAAPYYGTRENENLSSIHEGEDSEDSENDLDDIRDIRLGDVVISLHSKSSDAVVQYDFGKSLQERKFIRCGGRLNKPPSIVLAAISHLQARHELQGHKISETLSHKILINPTLAKKFQYPGSKKDYLFKPTVVHHKKMKTCTACRAPLSNCVKRKDRPDKSPRLHYGTIGSADQVMKDAVLRDKWAQDENIICFEMEAAGLMDSFPCLVIRGISDYADSHKNKVWQPYAAATAASYAKELLQNISGQGVMGMDPIEQIQRSMSEVHNIIKDTNTAVQALSVDALTDRQQRCHQAFKTSNYEKQKDFNPIRVPGTCKWVLQNRHYLRWRDSSCNSLLWISADPGCGKSVLAKSLIDDELAAYSSTMSVCYFFFKDNEEQNKLATALCTILHQLFSQQPRLVKYAMSSWEKNGEMIQHEIGELWRIFIDATSDPLSPGTICVLDALDECSTDDQSRLIQRLNEFNEQKVPLAQKTSLKFLITSRPYDEIRSGFQPITDSFPHIHLKGELENDQIRKEIDLVIKVRVKELNLPYRERERIENQLLRMEHRTYLWLYLAIDDIKTTIRDCLRTADVSIQEIPCSVSAAYEKILGRVPYGQVNTVRKVFQIIVAARRPLNIAEMAAALDIVFPPPLAGEKLDPAILGNKLRHLCGLFIFIKESRVYLLHQTAKEFLMAPDNWRQKTTQWQQSVNLQDANLALSQICLCCLHESKYIEDYHQSLNETEVMDRTDGLLIYSANHWISHMTSLSNPPTDLLRSAGKLCDRESVSVCTRFIECRILYLPEVNEPLPVFWAARWGLIDVAHFLLQDSQIQITHEIVEKAAAHPSDKGTVMRLLFDQREKEITVTEKALQKAAANKDSGLAIMKLLLDAKGDEIKMTSKVMEAAAENHSCGLAIIKLLMSRKGNEIKITSKIMESAASNWSSGPEMVRYLFDQKRSRIWITRRVLQAALSNPVDGERIIRIIASRSFVRYRLRLWSQRRGRDAREWNKLNNWDKFNQWKKWNKKKWNELIKSYARELSSKRSRDVIEQRNT